MNRMKSLCTVALIALAATGCSISTEDLTRNVRKNMEEKYTPKGIQIRSLLLTKKGGNEYTGVLETQEPNGQFTYNVEVVCDGKNFTWQVEPIVQGQ